MNTDTPVIEIQNLVRRYGKHDAVNGLSLRVTPGKCYGFFGRNGAGKTTTIKCLLNLLRPDAGTVRVFGLDPRRDEVAVKSRLAYVPDFVAFYPWMTVRDKLLLTEIDEAVVMAHHLQIDRDKFLALVRERLDYFESKSTHPNGSK